WFGYRVATSAAAAYTDAQARSAVIDPTYVLPSADGALTWTIVAGTSMKPAITAASITNAMLAGSIQPSKLQGSGGSTTTFLRNDGTWQVPPGTGGGGSFSSGNAYTWTNASGQTWQGANTFNTRVNTFSRTLAGAGSGTATVTTKLCAQYPEAIYQDGNAIDITLTDNYIPTVSPVG